MTQRDDSTANIRGRQYHPTPKVVRVQPATATKILNKNTMNRPLRDGRVDRYAAEMKAGKWRLNGETIKITKDGDLLDGQHRLFAVIEAGVAVDLMIIEGLDPSVMPTIDTGAPRSMGDVLAIGGGKNANTVAATLRWLVWYHRRKRGPSGPSKEHGKENAAYTNQALLEALPRYGGLEDRVREAVSKTKAKVLISGGVLSFVYFMAYRTDPAKAGAWLATLDSGIVEGVHNPVHALRERLIAFKASNRKPAAVEIAALASKSWNAYASGHVMKVLRWTSTEDFPAFVAPEDK